MCVRNNLIPEFKKQNKEIEELDYINHWGNECYGFKVKCNTEFTETVKLIVSEMSNVIKNIEVEYNNEEKNKIAIKTFRDKMSHFYKYNIINMDNVNIIKKFNCKWYNSMTEEYSLTKSAVK
jgi:hypothetical protein